MASQLGDNSLNQFIIKPLDTVGYAGEGTSYLKTVADIGRNYFIDRKTTYLGQAIQMLQPLAGKLCAQYGSQVYKRMMEDDAVAQAVNVSYMSIAMSEVTPTAAFEVNGYEDNIEGELNGAARFISTVFEDVEDWHETRQAAAYDLLVHGGSFASLTYEKGDGVLRDYLTYKSISPISLDDVVIITDNSHKIIGYAPSGIPSIMPTLFGYMPINDLITNLRESIENPGERMDSIMDTQFLPRWMVWHQRFAPVAGDPRGRRLLDPAIAAWWAKKLVVSQMLAIVDEWSKPRVAGKVGSGADTVCLYDANGLRVTDATDGLQVNVPATMALRMGIESVGNGGAYAVPSGYDISLLEANPEMLRALMEVTNYFDIAISKAIAAQHLASSEGARGNEKATTTHNELRMQLVHYCKSVESQSIRQQLYKPLISANFGRHAKRFAPLADNGSLLDNQVNFEAIGFMQQSGFLAPSQLAPLDRALHLPPRNQAKDVEYATLMAKINAPPVAAPSPAPKKPTTPKTPAGSKKPEEKQ